MAGAITEDVLRGRKRGGGGGILNVKHLKEGRVLLCCGGCSLSQSDIPPPFIPTGIKGWLASFACSMWGKKLCVVALCWLEIYCRLFDWSTLLFSLQNACYLNGDMHEVELKVCIIFQCFVVLSWFNSNLFITSLQDKKKKKGNNKQRLWSLFHTQVFKTLTKFHEILTWNYFMEK